MTFRHSFSYFEFFFKKFFFVFGEIALSNFVTCLSNVWTDGTDGTDGTRRDRTGQDGTEESPEMRTEESPEMRPDLELELKWPGPVVKKCKWQMWACGFLACMFALVQVSCWLASSSCEEMHLTGQDGTWQDGTWLVCLVAFSYHFRYCIPEMRQMWSLSWLGLGQLWRNALEAWELVDFLLVCLHLSRGQFGNEVPMPHERRQMQFAAVPPTTRTFTLPRY